MYERETDIDWRDTKCYVNGHEYEIGEKMKEEDETYCQKNCICLFTDELDRL